MELLELGWRVPRIFSAPLQPNCALDPQKFLRCKNVLKVLYHHANFGMARISPTTGAAKNVEFFVCVRVHHACEQQACEWWNSVHNFALNALKYGNKFDTIG